MKKIRFIINPKSGSGNKKNIPAMIEELIDRKTFEAEICFTKAAGHATELAKEAVNNKYDVVVAVGGDGSVNETAKSLVKTDTALGIIPTGSGNGMSLHLGIAVDIKRAIGILNTGTVDTIDTVVVNESFCIGTIGVGFDAHVAHLFSKHPKRGYSTYVKLVLSEFSKYKQKDFTIEVDGVVHEKKCFLLTFANSSQFGNNARIAPAADVKDGILEISIMKRFPPYVAPVLIYRLMNNCIQHSRYFESMRGKNIILKNDTQLQGHIDGEPVIFEGDLKIKINPLSLKVIVPSR